METTDDIWQLTYTNTLKTQSISVPIKQENYIPDHSIASNSFDEDKNYLTFEIDRDVQSSDENAENESTDFDDSTAASESLFLKINLINSLLD